MPPFSIKAMFAFPTASADEIMSTPWNVTGNQNIAYGKSNMLQGNYGHPHMIVIENPSLGIEVSPVWMANNVYIQY